MIQTICRFILFSKHIFPISIKKIHSLKIIISFEHKNWGSEKTYENVFLKET